MSDGPVRDDMGDHHFVVGTLAWATALWLGKLTVEDYAEAIIGWTRRGWKAEAST